MNEEDIINNVDTVDSSDAETDAIQNQNIDSTSSVETNTDSIVTEHNAEDNNTVSEYVTDEVNTVSEYATEENNIVSKSRKKKAKQPKNMKKILMIFSIIFVLIAGIAGGVIFGIYHNMKTSAPDPTKLNDMFEFNNLKGDLTIFETVGDDGITAKIVYNYSLTGNNYIVTFYNSIEKANEAVKVATDSNVYNVVNQRKTAVYCGGKLGGDLFIEFM